MEAGVPCLIHMSGLSSLLVYFFGLFLGPPLWHIDIPSLEIESEL